MSAMPPAAVAKKAVSRSIPARTACSTAASEVTTMTKMVATAMCGRRESAVASTAGVKRMPTASPMATWPSSRPMGTNSIR